MEQRSRASRFCRTSDQLKYLLLFEGKMSCEVFFKKGKKWNEIKEHHSMRKRERESTAVMESSKWVEREYDVIE